MHPNGGGGMRPKRRRGCALRGGVGRSKRRVGGCALRGGPEVHPNGGGCALRGGGAP